LNEIRSTKNPTRETAKPITDRTAGEWAGSVSLVVSAIVFAPIFLVSCLIADIGASFAFGVLELGIVLCVYYAVGAVASILAGIWVDRVGARATLVIASLLTGGSALACGFAQSWQTIAVAFGVGGCAGGMAGPAAVRLLVSAFPPARWAMAFALRQSSVPFTAILIGLYAAGAQSHVGWRVSFFGFAAITGVIAVATLALGYEGGALKRAPDSGNLRAWTIALLIVGAVLLGAGVTTFAGFVVASGIAVGMSPEGASLLLAASSVVAILARLFSGWSAGRRSGGHLLRVAVMLFFGAVGSVAIAYAHDPLPLFVPAIIFVSATAWASNALFTFAIVNRQAHAPAKATSIVQIGAFVGSAIGPFVFGFTTEHAGGRVAWLYLALWFSAASGVMMLARRTFAVHAPAAPPN